MADIVQIIPADGWWAVAGTGQREPVAAWALTGDGDVVGLVSRSGDPKTPHQLIFANQLESGLVSFYRDGQGVCQHQLRENAKTSAEDPNWCADCRADILG
jgi:hypothetical protein